MTRTKSMIMTMRLPVFAACLLAAAILFAFALAPRTPFAHGDVTPQAVDTSGLPDLGDKWASENPWRDPDGEYWERAVEVGASGYNQNCARCHGLGAISGGLAPDLRYLEANFDGDEWYLERYRNGMTQNGITKMPAFGELLGQEAAWAIRTFTETRADDGSLDEHSDKLFTIRDTLTKQAEAIKGGADAGQFAGEAKTFRTDLIAIAKTLPTGSGAPRAHSIVNRAADALDGSADGYGRAAEILTVGLSAAK